MGSSSDCGKMKRLGQNVLMHVKKYGTFVLQAIASYFSLKKTQKSTEHGCQVDGRWSQRQWVGQILGKERWKGQGKAEYHMNKLLGKEGKTSRNRC